MQSIDVADLPEPVAKAMAAMVESVRTQIHQSEKEQKHLQPAELPKWPGQVIGPLNRREIYDDAR